MPTLNPKITTAGLNLAANPALPGVSVEITHMALGTGKYDPTGEETALAAELVRFPVTGGSSPADNQVQINAIVANLDSQGRTANGQWIGELGFYAGTTLFAIWSRAEVPLFYKTADFDVALAYTLDVSALPADSITVIVDPNIASMQALVQEHEAKANPHAQYTTAAEVATIVTEQANSSSGTLKKLIRRRIQSYM